MVNNCLQAINIIECPEFRCLICLLQPLLDDTDIFHHTKACELIIDTFHEYFNALKRDLAVGLPLSRALQNISYLQAAQGKVLFTSDLWSDSNLCPFMALIAHWIAKADHNSALVLKVVLIGFHHVPGSHTGKLLASVILHLLDHAGVTEKVSVSVYHLTHFDFV
jgi:hypothetical protein